MAYFDIFDKEHFNELGLSFQMFNPYPLTDADVKRSLLIADEIITNYDRRRLDKSDELTFGSVLQSAATVYYNLGMHSSAKKAVSILQGVQYQDNKSNDAANLTVQSLMVRTGAMVSKQPYYVDVPRVFNSTSIHFMAHEIAHMLKESNPYECKGVQSDIEVIPILVEMISAHTKGDNNVFKKRELIMLDIAKSFKKLHQDKITGSISREDELAFDTCYRHYLTYLNSFYYSLRLFTMYLEAPNYVLGVIDDVLNHRITSREVISNYLRDSSYSYESGMEEFRSRLK